MNNRKGSNWIWGSFFIVCALLVVLNGLNVFSLTGFLWKIIVTLFFVLWFIESRQKKDTSGMVISGLVIFMMWKNVIGLGFLSIGTIILAGILLLVGIGFLNKPRTDHAPESRNVFVNDVDSDTLNVKGAFNSSSHYLRGSEVETVYITPSFCSMSVYLDQLTTKSGTLEVIVDAGFCSLNIYVPKNGRSTMRCMPCSARSLPKASRFLKPKTRCTSRETETFPLYAFFISDRANVNKMKTDPALTFLKGSARNTLNNYTPYLIKCVR